jgi:hypothetical protein
MYQSSRVLQDGHPSFVLNQHFCDSVYMIGGEKLAASKVGTRLSLCMLPVGTLNSF